MNKFTSALLLFFVLWCGSTQAQVSYTARDQVTPNNDPFRFGSNFGYNPPWQDEQLADIAAGNPAIGVSGVGVKTSRPTLPGWFVEEYGYDFRLGTFQHYFDLGLKDNVCIVGFPSDDQKDQTQHCSGVQSEMFANLYEPIWDGGANGTPYNDNNYYAAYLHKVVSMYKDHVRYWEIWNEPGFDYTGNCGWREPGDPICNWWDQNPDPCDNKLRAPIQEYVRTLRISYDIIKSVDPDAYVVVAGVGFESFLDAILRNTDNPADGSVTAEYPYGGGAYFDVMGFHSYPHFDGTMKYWDNASNSFVYERHSDKAITGILGRQTRYQNILGNYGFDGSTFPKKEWIITEINAPRKQFQDFAGSPEFQRNFIIKAAVTCMRNAIHSMHVYNLGERKVFNEATGAFDLFGLYEVLKGNSAYTQVKTEEGVAYKTTSDLVFGSIYDENRTAQLNLPSTVDGGAFLDPDGNYTYILWAKTNQDMSEAATATYAFPSNLNVSYLEKRNWEYSETFESAQVDPNSITLTGEPAFFTESILSTDVSSGCQPLSVNFAEQFTGAAASYNWTFEGGSPATSTAATPSVTFQDAGTYDVTLEVLDASGNVIGTQTSFIVVTAAPVSEFTYTLSGPIIVFENTSTSNAESQTWVFGDGSTSTEDSPTHVYQNNGNYTVTLISSNGCGASTQTATINVNTSSNFQLPFNANTTLTPYDGPFRPGTNFGYNPPWNDVQLADIAAGNPALGIKGVGAKASRPSFPGWFANEYGYEFNTSTFEHYDNLGLEDNVLIIGFPAPEERDQAFYCPGVQSEMFANMYSDIWDGGANGTPYNDDNYLAAYLYKVVQIYGDDVKFWEIWNEPGFDYTGNCGWREPGDPVCNWWDQNPDPCDFKLRAPIMHYVRILRISYEIIKTLQPEDYLVVAGVGFPSYLDAILRNTDNPVDGSVTADYPNGGGAYFDVMGFHAYPHFDGTMRWWDNSIGGFHYERHSDQAIKGITNRQDLYQQVLENYGYDGATYPNKEWIITESNLPRREFQDYIGNEDAQINFMAKAVVTCYKQNIHQFHVYNLGEAENFSSANREFDLMGLYQKLITNQPYTQVVNQEGISYKTVSDMLFGTEYDEAKTNAMSLPANIDGAAFVDAAGNYLYALWAVTETDQSEVANATYSFPASFGISQLTKREWDYSETNAQSVLGPNSIALTGRPIYLFENPNTIVAPTASFFPDISVGCAPFTVNFQDMSNANIDSWNWTITDPSGTVVYTTTDQNPSYNFATAGEYQVVLEVTNPAGTNVTTQTISAEGALTAGFTYVVNGNTVTFTNTSTNGSQFNWGFDDNTNTNQENPGSHTYALDGLYNVGLTVINSCDTMSLYQLIEIGSGGTVLPTADFSISNSGGCGPISVNYFNMSSSATSISWSFPGGNPSTSTEQNPTVVYSTPGVYDAILNATNSAGTTTYTQSGLISVLAIPEVNYTYDISNSPTISFGNNSVGGVSYFWDFGDGNVSSLPNPTHTYSIGGAYDVVLTAANGCGSASFSQILNIDAGNLPPSASFTSDNINGCEPMTINFTDSSIGATSWNWSFPGGTPSSSTDQNPEVLYNNAGTYDVTLEVTNINGTDSQVSSSYITVLALPTTDYTFVVQDSLVTFTNLSSNVSSTSWNFQDGTFSTQTNPTHVFTQSGVYDVVLTSANGCGSTMATYSIEVVTGLSSGPVPDFVASPTVGCAPMSVTYMDQSSGTPIAWNWSFPGGTPSTSTEQNPTVSYSTSGIYPVTLEAIDNNGANSVTQSSFVNVMDVPVADYSFVVDGADVTFTNATSGAVSYSWNFGDGTFSTDVNPTHTFTNAGTYPVELFSANGCGSNAITFDVVITTGTGVAPTASFAADVFSGCAPTVINYSDLSAGSPTSWQWTFPGGTPAVSTDQNPTVTYNSGGVFDATLEVTNSIGSNTSTQTSYITVNAAPDVSFTSTTNGLSATFNNTTTNADSYAWDFGDGNTSTDQNPVHTYTVGGNYQVTLTATNACGFVMITQPVSFGVAPSVAFTSDVTTGCAPLTVNFNDLSSGNPTAWNWTFNGGSVNSSTDQNPTVTYTTAGVYGVTLEASNSIGSNSMTQTVYIIVEDVPAANFFTSIAGLAVDFTNTTPNGTTYTWDFGDGTMSNDANPNHTYTIGGTYTVTLTSSNACGTSTTTQVVTVITNIAPVSNFNSNVTSGCAPLTVNFNDLSTGAPTAWNWTFNGGSPSSSTDQNPTVFYNNAGTYSVTLETTNPAGTDVFTQNVLITVEDVPQVSFINSISGLSVDFSNTTQNGTTYTWDFGDGNTSTTADPSHTYTDGGTYTVTLTATNDCGTSTTTQDVTIISLPVTAFTADVTSGCAPISVNYNNLSTGNITAWSWSFPGGTPNTSTDENPVVSYSTAGTYDVTLVATNSSGGTTVTQNSFIVVEAAPTASFTSNSNVLTTTFNNTTTNATSYSWDFGDGSVSIDENPTYTYAAGGIYMVTLTATNACGSVTTTQQVAVVAAPVAAFTSDVVSGCSPFTVNYSDQSLGGVTGWSWSFPGGTPSTSNIANPTVTYSTPGVYDVSLVSTNISGSNGTTQTSYIVVETVPNIVFGSSTSSLTATFNNMTTGATSYAWDFGDGNMSTDENPSHTYITNGTYTVTLTATNACGTVTSTEMIEVLFSGSAPTAVFTSDATSGCSPFTVTFTDQSTGGATGWSWSFPGGTPSTSNIANPTVTYATSGMYDVELIVSNAGGSNTASQTSYIIVNTQPTADFTSSANGNIVSFTNNTTGATSYSWSFGDGNTSTDANPTHTYAMDGTYDVVLNVTNDCGTVMAMSTVTITTAPTVAFTSDNTTGCAPLTVNFSDLSSSNVNSWSWDMPGATPATSTDQNPSVTYDTPGTYDVSLTATNASGNYTVTTMAMIVVESGPTAAFDVLPSGFTYSFTNNSTGAVSYEWDFGDGNMSTDANPTHTYAMSGSYTVQLVSTNVCGTDTTSLLINIEAAPVAGFTADTTLGCAPFTVQFTDQSINASSWNWTFEGGTPATSTDQNPTVTYDTPGTYTVDLTVSNSTGMDNVMTSSFIVVEAAPTASYVFSMDTTTVTFMNSSTGGTSYLWEFGDGNTSTDENPVHTYDTNGVYTVLLMVTNDCGTVTFENTILIDYTDIEPIIFIEEFKLFPNPNRGRFTVLIKGQPKDELNMRLINILGQYLHDEELDFSSGNLLKTFDFNHLSSGTYIVELRSKQQVLFKKVVIE